MFLEKISLFLDLCKKFVYKYYYPPDNYYNPNKAIKLFLRELRLSRIFRMLFHFGNSLLITVGISSGKNIFYKYMKIESLRKLTNANKKMIFYFPTFYNILSIGNLAVANQYIRIWAKENNGIQKILCFSHSKKYKSLLYNLSEMNPDIDEVWAFYFPNYLRILSNLPGVIEVKEVFKPWFEVEIRVLNDEVIPPLLIPDEKRKWAKKFLLNFSHNKNARYISAHIREDPKRWSAQTYRNPDFQTYVEFLKYIIEKYNVFIIRLGSADDTPLEFPQLIDTTKIKLSYPEQCALISESIIFVGCHSGPQITAAAIGVPTFCGSYVEDTYDERKKWNMKSVRTPKIQKNLRKVLYKKCMSPNGKKVAAGFDTPKDYEWIDTSLNELKTEFNKFYKKVSRIKN